MATQPLPSETATQERSLLVRNPEIVRVEDFMPVFTVQQAVERKSQINQFIDQVLRESIDFGVIPGAASKPVLLKPGAEKLCSIFGLAPFYESEQVIEDWAGQDHGGESFFYYRYKCRLFRGERCMGEAIGSANSWEAKYRWREQQRVCPTCGKQGIIAGKEEYGGGWLCWKKKGGCGAKFEPTDKRITDQPSGRVANPDVADQVNTIQKMAQKRALVAAVLVVTNCSDAFTQDLEDQVDTGGHPPNTEAAANHIRDRKLSELDPTLTEEIRPYYDRLPAKGGMKECFAFIQDEAIKAGGSDAEKIILAMTQAFRSRHPEPIPPLADIQQLALVCWGEVLRLRKIKEARQKDEADSAFALG